jgi:methionine-rich copper-binding protein CopC
VRAAFAVATTVAVLLGLRFDLGRALAHAEVVSTVPAAGSTVRAAELAEVVLTFDEPLSRGSQIVLYAEAFQGVAGVETRVEAERLVGRLGAPLAPGTYTVQWTAVGADGHPAQGSYQFGVGGDGGGAPIAGLAVAAGAAAVVLLGAAAWLLGRRRVI